MSDWETGYNFDTVINKNEFIDSVEIKDCEYVGRSLVARRSICRGEVVLVESPLLQYFLEPTCRSSLSPFYSKQIWKTLKGIVQSEDPSIEQQTTTAYDNSRSSSSYSDTDDESNYCHSDDDESDTDDDDSSTPSSLFNPGVPAAMLAFLQLYPPTTNTRLTESTHFQQVNPSKFDFFYYPSTDMDHATVQLVCRAAKRVVQEINVYRHVDPELLATFVLKIYGNAHTVALDRKANHRSTLTTKTHSKKHHRRQTIYAHRNGQDSEQQQDDSGTTATSWGSTSAGPRSSIALMLWGSKFSHACSPNLLLQYDPPTNTMVFVATRAISTGDILTFSYLPEDESLGGLICGTTECRRAKLQQFKFFECECNRCQGKDGSRGADCPEKCGGDNQQTGTTWYQGSARTWECEHCHSTATPLFVSPQVEKGESYVERMVTGMATKVRNGGDGSSSGVVHIMETYLNNLLQRGHDGMDDNNGALVAAIPQLHWTFGYIHGLLAIYHVELFPRTFGKGLASQLGLTETGFKEARLYIIDFLHKQLWSTNPVPVFFAAWHVLAPVIKATMDSTEEKQYYVPEKKSKRLRTTAKDGDNDDSDTSSDDNSDSDMDESPVMLAPLVIAMSDEWSSYIDDMADVVSNQWVPVIKEIFAGRSSVVVDEMINLIQNWTNRVNECKALV